MNTPSTAVEPEPQLVVRLAAAMSLRAVELAAVNGEGASYQQLAEAAVEEIARRPLNAVAEYGEPVAWADPRDLQRMAGKVQVGGDLLGQKAHRFTEPLYSAATVSALVAERDELVQALRDIAKQKLSREVDEYIGCDFEGGYDACIERARAALQSQEPREVKG